MGLVGNVWAEIGGDASGLKKAAQEGKDALKSIGNEAQSASTQSTSAFDNLTTKAALAIGGIVAALKTAQEVFNLASEGAQIASLEQASIKLAKTYDTSMTDIVNAVQKASFYTITDYDAMKAANLAMTMGISTDATEISQLMQIAIERGRAFGLTTEDAFDRITRGIGRRSTRILDDLGFTVNAIQANKEYAASLGISTSALTDDMKVRALFESVLKEGNAELEKQGGLMMDVSTPYQQATTKISQAFQDVKKSLAYGFLDLFASPEERAQIQEQRLAIAYRTKDYKEYYAATTQLAEAQGKQAWEVHYLTKEEFKLREIADGYAGVMKTLTDTTWKFGYAIDGLIMKESLEVGLSGAIAKAQETYAEAMKKAGRNTKKQQVAIDDLHESYQSFILDAMQSLGFDPMATWTVGMKFGEMDTLSMAMFAAIGEVQNLGLGATETAERILDIYNNFDEINNLKLQDKSFNILVNFLVNGIPTYDFTSFSQYMLGGFGGVNINKPLDITAKHGGSFIGLQHGGIVPPGFSNDGMPIWVSSGERVDVTPAGNKTVSGEGATVNRFYAPVTLQIDKTTAKDIMRELRL